MGYERKRKIFKLVFADEEMDGLEVKAGSPSLETFLKLQKMAGVTVGMEEFAELVGHFTDSLISWNLTEDGVPVPVTAEGVRSQDPEFILAAMDSWMDAVNGVDAPLAAPSRDGDPSLVASIPMEPLPASQAS